MSRVESEEETSYNCKVALTFISPDLVMEATAASISTECFTGKILVRESEDYQLQISSIYYSDGQTAR
ncbi:hypothetical protein EB796_008044 [Bugula neritina]|uniref:Uncharacterized protein n=1 Tax=Bugula neritina TaxID=10212 RepID=A0A7J7K4S9_BUGNE|nr:hypothetical protein EB796_008044 [Bugula neritina]